MNTSRLQKLIVMIPVLGALGAQAQVTNSNYTGPDMGNWGTAANWTPATVPNNTGIMSFNVSIADYAVSLDIDPTVSILSFGGDSASIASVDHSLTSSATSVTASGGLDFSAEITDVLMNARALADFSGTTLTGGTYRFTAAPGHTALFKFNGADIRTNSASLSLIGAGARVQNESSADAFENLALNTVDGFLEFQNGQHITTPGSFTNDGYLIYYAGTTLTVNGDLINLGDFRDQGTVGFLDGLSRAGQNSLIVVNGVLPNYDAATKSLNKGRYFFGSTDGAPNTLQVLGGPLLDIVTNNASIILQGSERGLIDKNGANALRNLASNTRYLQVGAINFTTVGDLTNTGARTNLIIQGDTNFTVSGNLRNSATLIVSPTNGYRFLTDVVPPVPVDPPALATEVKVTGNLVLESDSILEFDLFGPSAQAMIKVTGSATFGGVLSPFVLDDQDAPVTNADSLTVLTAASISGQFANVGSGHRVAAQKYSDFTPAGSFRATYNGTSLILSEYLPHAGLLNLSSRARVQTGDNVTIAGFIVGGIDAKQMLVRGLGASLASKGVTGSLSDPSLELFDGTGVSVVSNNDWKDSQESEIQATGLAPTDSHESAILATLAPGSYTAVLRGVANTSGVGLVEVYDLDSQPALGELVNISTRGRVGTGDDVLIGGIIIQPGETAHLIVRAIGASLTNQHVIDPLADPTLDLYNSSGAKLMSNDNWNDDPAQSALIQKEGLAPTDIRESALLGTLAPGSYTAIVRGKNNTQGVALVEFYKLN